MGNTRKKLLKIKKDHRRKYKHQKEEMGGRKAFLYKLYIKYSEEYVYAVNKILKENRKNKRRRLWEKER